MLSSVAIQWQLPSQHLWEGHLLILINLELKHWGVRGKGISLVSEESSLKNTDIINLSAKHIYQNQIVLQKSFNSSQFQQTCFKYSVICIYESREEGAKNSKKLTSLRPPPAWIHCIYLSDPFNVSVILQFVRSQRKSSHLGPVLYIQA